MAEVLQVKYNPEKREVPFPVVLVSCMDEGLCYGPGILVAGVGGSAVTQLETGDQVFFPDEKRKLVERVRPVLYNSLERVADDLGFGFGIASHVGCGWAGAQGISEEKVSYSTLVSANRWFLDYYGHISHSQNLVELNCPGLAATMTRPESDHHHDASRIALTVGGFITQNEIEKLTRKEGKPFVISADWIAKVARVGGDIKEALDFVELEIDVACGICPGVSKTDSVRIFNAKRIEQLEWARNLHLMRALMQRFTL